jgi:hypothetical protein
MVFEQAHKALPHHSRGAQNADFDLIHGYDSLSAPKKSRVKSRELTLGVACFLSGPQQVESQESRVDPRLSTVFPRQSLSETLQKPHPALSFRAKRGILPWSLLPHPPEAEQDSSLRSE